MASQFSLPDGTKASNKNKEKN